MHPSAMTDLKTFLPTKDAELSKRFYIDLGFMIHWSNESHSSCPQTRKAALDLRRPIVAVYSSLLPG